jgi:methionine synthase II (cobalamin-independent)
METTLTGGLATGIGSLPHRDAVEAAEWVLAELPDLPAVPSLPRRHPAELMLAQGSVGIPGVTIDRDGRLKVKPRVVDPAVSIEVDLGHEAFGGLRAFAQVAAGRVGPIKWQVTGPLTLALELRRHGVPAQAAFDVAANAVQAHLRAVHHLLSEAMPSATQVVLLDEPDIAGLHAASFPLAPDAALDILSGCLATLGGSAIAGIHCCATDVDLSSLLAAGPAVLSVPVHQGVVAAAGYLATFLDNGGWIAWGVVPTDRPIATSADRYWRELSALWCELVQAGCDAATLRRRCIVTPACGLGLYELDQAGGVLGEVRDIAERVIGQAVATRLSLGA